MSICWEGSCPHGCLRVWHREVYHARCLNSGITHTFCGTFLYWNNQFHFKNTWLLIWLSCCWIVCDDKTHIKLSDWAGFYAGFIKKIPAILRCGHQEWASHFVSIWEIKPESLAGWANTLTNGLPHSPQAVGLIALSLHVFVTHPQEGQIICEYLVSSFNDYDSCTHIYDTVG